MPQPAILPAGTASVRPKQSQGAAGGPSGWKRWARLQGVCAGGTPALPGGAGADRGPALPEQAPQVGDVLAQDLAGVGFSLVLDGQAAVVIQALELAQQGLKINRSLLQ